MDLLNISYTEKSSVLNEGEMSFTLLQCMQLRIWPVLGICTVISSPAQLDNVALCLACQTFEPEDQG